MNEKMAAWWALCWREWLEHRAALAWTPLILTALLFIITLVVALSTPERVLIAADSAQGPEQLATASIIAQQITSVIAVLVRPYTWLYFVVTISLLLSSLFDERKDRTILFWKSMPTSDTQVVLSKLFVLVGGGALISLVLILISQLYLVLLSMANSASTWGVSGADLWSAATLGTSTLQWVAGYFTQLFWWLPLWGWLLLVSSTAPRAPILWALLVPIVVMFIEAVAFNSSHLANSVASHVKLTALPSQSAVLESLDGSNARTLGDLWISSDMWLGIATGVVLIALAIFFRRRNNEL